MKILRELVRFFRLLVDPRQRQDSRGEVENSEEFEVAREKWRGV